VHNVREGWRIADEALAPVRHIARRQHVVVHVDARGEAAAAAGLSIGGGRRSCERC